MLVKSLRRIIWRLLTDCWNLNFLQLYVRINIWRHSVMSKKFPEASVDFSPSPKIINDDNKLEKKGDHRCWKQDKCPQSLHVTIIVKGAAGSEHQGSNQNGGDNNGR